MSSTRGSADVEAVGRLIRASEALGWPENCAQICAHPTSKMAHVVSLDVTRKHRNHARLYCSNSQDRRQCETAPMNLLTGGLLVRVQPEEPISRQSTAVSNQATFSVRHSSAVRRVLRSAGPVGSQAADAGVRFPVLSQGSFGDDGVGEGDDVGLDSLGGVRLDGTLT